MAGVNHFALLESNDPGDTRLAHINNKQQPAASITQELFGRAYPSAWKIIRNREKQQQSGASGPASATDGDRAKNAQQGGAKKKGGGRHANVAAAGAEAPAPRLYDLAQFPSLK
ncbi:unnamed protein product [Urochloa decumbens]|uniref:Uncharacterized protein n=1 Tax=Urochloa decumbens TaxID=240449 RepID=A0ABC9D4J0_9POAL